MIPIILLKRDDHRHIQLLFPKCVYMRAHTKKKYKAHAYTQNVQQV
jgi:hypothetical protein